MKFTNRSLLAGTAVVSFFLFSILTGCKKSNDSVTPPDFSATVDGTSFQTRTTDNFFDQSYQYFHLVGYMPTTDQDSLYLELDLPVTFHLNQPIDLSDIYAGISYYDLNGLQDFSASARGGHGSITVTSWDSVNHKIAGTFSGELLNGVRATTTLEITNGHFNTVYVIQP